MVRGMDRKGGRGKFIRRGGMKYEKKRMKRVRVGKESR